jgi:hypothetical protein
MGSLIMNDFLYFHIFFHNINVNSYLKFMSAGIWSILYLGTFLISFLFIIIRDFSKSIHIHEHLLHFDVISVYMYVYICMMMIICAFTYLTCRSSFCKWGKTCDLGLFEPGLLCLTWCSPVPAIYLQTT